MCAYLAADKYDLTFARQSSFEALLEVGDFGGPPDNGFRFTRTHCIRAHHLT